MPQNKKNRGISLIGLVFLGFILILVISYFGISIRSVVESETGQDNINYVQDETKSVWDAYLKEPASYLWNDVWLDIFWRGFIDNMKRIRDGGQTHWSEAAPTVYDEGNSSAWGE